MKKALENLEKSIVLLSFSFVVCMIVNYTCILLGLSDYDRGLFVGLIVMWANGLFYNFMKEFKAKKWVDSSKKAFGVKCKLFFIIKSGTDNRHIYYIRIIGKGEKFYRILKSKKRVAFLSKYVLSFIAILGMIFTCVLFPLYCIINGIYLYFLGLKNFITDSCWCEGVKFFGWVNIIIALAAIACLIILEV